MRAPSFTRRMTLVLAIAGAATTAGLGVLAPAATAADATPAPSSDAAPSFDGVTPSPGATTVTKAGTSFLTATAVSMGQPVKVSAATGEYLYWSFPATAGQVPRVVLTVTLPPAQSRHANSTWTVDVFDGLRRRQACTAGAQTPTASASEASTSLGCVLREVRSWAEPWSGDPLPGDYVVRLSVIDLPEQDLGLPVQVDMLITAEESDDPMPEGGNLRVPLKPAANPGAVLAPGVVVSSGTAASPGATVGAGATAGAATTAGSAANPGAVTSSAAADGDDSDGTGWFDDVPSRWIWTTVGGVLAAIAGVFGFSLTRRPRREARTAA